MQYGYHILSETIQILPRAVSREGKRSQAMPSLIFGSQQTMHIVYGVDFAEEDKLLDSLVVTEGSLDELGANDDVIILPQPVGERLGVEVGETILIRLETLTGLQPHSFRRWDKER